jgi:hypothetical protein
MDGQRFHFAFDRTVIDQFERAELGETHTGIMGDAKARLRIGETVVASMTLEAWVAWLLTCFATSKEGFECQINTHSDVLQNLGMDGVERGALFFEHRIRGLLTRATHAFAVLLIGSFACFKQMVVEPSALFKRGFKTMELLFCWVYSIHNGFLHASIGAQFKQNSNSCLKLSPFIPMLESRGLLATLVKYLQK